MIESMVDEVQLQDWVNVKKIVNKALEFKEKDFGWRSVGAMLYYFNLNDNDYKHVLEFLEENKEYGMLATFETLKKTWTEFYEKEMNEILNELKSLLETKHSMFLNKDFILDDFKKRYLKKNFFFNFDNNYGENFFLVWNKIEDKFGG
jgi:hypothetical protein